MDDFYTFHNLRRQEDAVSCEIRFNKGHAIFKGHFPTQPVVPGVCMMEIVKQLLQLQAGKNLWLRKAGNVKFLQLITPEAIPAINITWKENETGYSVNAFFTEGETVLFKLTGNYEMFTPAASRHSASAPSQ